MSSCTCVRLKVRLCSGVSWIRLGNSVECKQQYHTRKPKRLDDDTVDRHFFKYVYELSAEICANFAPSCCYSVVVLELRTHHQVSQNSKRWRLLSQTVFTEKSGWELALERTRLRLLRAEDTYANDSIFSNDSLCTRLDWLAELQTLFVCHVNQRADGFRFNVARVK